MEKNERGTERGAAKARRTKLATDNAKGSQRRHWQGQCCMVRGGEEDCNDPNCKLQQTWLEVGRDVGDSCAIVWPKFTHAISKWNVKLRSAVKYATKMA